MSIIIPIKKVGTALQVFHNLGMLAVSVEKFLDTLIDRLNKSVTNALDVNVLSQTSQSHVKKGKFIFFTISKI